MHHSDATKLIETYTLEPMIQLELDTRNKKLLFSKEHALLLVDLLQHAEVIDYTDDYTNKIITKIDLVDNISTLPKPEYLEYKVDTLLESP